MVGRVTKEGSVFLNSKTSYYRLNGQISRLNAQLYW